MVAEARSERAAGAADRGVWQVAMGERQLRTNRWLVERVPRGCDSNASIQSRGSPASSMLARSGGESWSSTSLANPRYSSHRTENLRPWQRLPSYRWGTRLI